jgi:20S proteasome subunit beta 1
MEEKDAEEFVREAVALAMTRDGSSGGLIRMVIITERGAERKMIPGDKVPYTAESEGAKSGFY